MRSEVRLTITAAIVAPLVVAAVQAWRNGDMIGALIYMIPSLLILVAGMGWARMATRAERRLNAHRNLLIDLSAELDQKQYGGSPRGTELHERVEQALAVLPDHYRSRWDMRLEAGNRDSQKPQHQLCDQAALVRQFAKGITLGDLR